MQNTHPIDYNKFVDEQLAQNNYFIKELSEEFIRARLKDFMSLMNDIIIEYKDIYGWKEENEEYFLNGMVEKWKYSYTVLDASENICFMSLNSRYNNALHFHSIFTKKELRGVNFTKLMMIKAANKALINNIDKLELYCPKYNSKAIILYLKIGFRIQSIRDDISVFLTGEPGYIRNRCYELVLNEKKII